MRRGKGGPMRVTYSCDLCVWALWKAQESAGFECQRCEEGDLQVIERGQ